MAVVPGCSDRTQTGADVVQCGSDAAGAVQELVLSRLRCGAIGRQRLPGQSTRVG